MKFKNFIFAAVLSIGIIKGTAVNAEETVNSKLTAGVTSMLSSIDFTAETEPIDISENEQIVVEQPYEEPEPNYIQIESTAYTGDPYCADGTRPRHGVLAGKSEWIGKSVELYDCDYNYMGDYTFHDTGYGQSTGWGRSSLAKGKHVGTIEAGECIDIYMDSHSECIDYGRRTVYLVWKE